MRTSSPSGRKGRPREELDVSQPGRVKRALSLDGTDDRVLLLNWGIEEAPRVCNIARVDRLGAVIWRVALPGDAQPDCFIALRREHDMFVARTYSGHDILFDLSGQHITDSVLSG